MNIEATSVCIESERGCVRVYVSACFHDSTCVKPLSHLSSCACLIAVSTEEQ